MDRENIYTVSEINAVVKSLVEVDMLKQVGVEGEISNFKDQFTTGHWYFTLKDAESSVRVVMFSGNNRFVDFTPQNGMKVLLRGSVTVYAKGGIYQINAREMFPSGIGDLRAAFEKLKEKLEKEGLFDKEKKKKIKTFPRTVGVVTSGTGAAVRDVINVMRRRNPNVDIYIYPAKVQGEGAAEEISAGIRFFNEEFAVDTVIIGRGGGSIEDLWEFNDEDLARTIFASRIPVISAVGHEIDYTIADYAADMRAPTPSAAAEMVAESKDELQSELRHLCMSLSGAFGKYAENARKELDLLEKHLAIFDPVRRIDDGKMSVMNAAIRLEGAFSRLIGDKDLRLENRAARLGALNPFAVLKRGYSVVLKDGKAVSHVEELAAGDMVKIRMSDGEAQAAIASIASTAATASIAEIKEAEAR